MSLCGDANISLNKAAPTNFMLSFPLLPTQTSLSGSIPLVLNIFSAVIPSISLNSEEKMWQNAKVKGVQSPMEFDQWLVNFMVDDYFYSWKCIFDWMSYINNNKDKMMERESNFKVDASLIILNNFKSQIMNITFVGIWPTTLGEVSMNQREGDVALESMVNFNYDYFKVESV